MFRFLLKFVAFIFAPVLVCVIYTILEKNGLLPILGGTIVTIVLVIALNNYLLKYIKRKRDLKEKETTPCCHGVPGAAFFTERCDICKKEKDKETAIRLANKEAERQRSYNNYIYNIKLPEYLKGMHPREFELLILELYSRMGYETTATQFTSDNGIDGFVEKEGRKGVLQCKRVKGSVGEPILRDLFGTMHATNSDFALVVTTGKVSSSARNWADGKPIEIIELNELRNLINQFFNEGEIVPSSFMPELSKGLGSYSR